MRIKTIAQWLINKAQFEEYLESNNKNRFAIVITIANKAEVSKLCIKNLRFGGVFKVVEKY